MNATGRAMLRGNAGTRDFICMTFGNWEMSNLDSPQIANIRDQFQVFARGSFDAARAWSISPTWYAFVARKTQRPFTFREQFKAKCKGAKCAFTRSIRIGRAPAVVIRRMGTEGLMANFLHVLEALHRVRPDAEVDVDWKLSGDELGFRFGAPGTDVWSGLFRPIKAGPRPGAYSADGPIDWAFWGTGKDHLSGTRLQNHREAYRRTIAKWIEITNETVLERTERTYAEFFQGRFCLGIHRRVGNSGVANLQKDGQAPSLETLLTTCNRALHAAAGQDPVVFLATDDADCVSAFKRAFGSRLIVQDNVKRTIASKREVHFRDWGHLSLSDAEDVLVDTLLLSRCNLLVHASSSVSTAAALFNPSLALVRAYTGGTAWGSR